MYVGFCQGHVKERDSLEHPVIDKITLQWSLKKKDGMVWTGLSRLWTGKSGAQNMAMNVGF